ncbi:thiamine-binding protein [Corynebacterium uberis]|uniref:thiamine-binding protein n=1 Tax=Corynebacterium TaxID=1716 RepID=UPI001D0ABD7F|nr:MULTISPECIES: thiamine-binding protein [Corynebacterium]MCZ9309060.1 thiamine-binding protein [Corynebacterium sp. c6VSa_13]UDL74475.1 thiamine-binding protein [Corynebacterium uberis]UDL76690.1 thiamine-binding protein [Corynebacterium uberis]UDL78903.1 thiamine-binding protein [Corynebacterium uberis]UDL81181.1 thiamine-binding protein [Corynebacterium uberis]
MIVAFSVAPTQTPGHDAEMSAAVARAVRVVRESGLPNETNAMFTLVEGQWDEVMDVVHRATLAVAEVSPRVSLVLKADIRAGHTGQLTQKVESLEAQLAAQSPAAGPVDGEEKA